jgi:serine/threonine-protein kinase RsbW
LAALETATRQVTELLKSREINSQTLRTASLGLEEVITNIIKYGYDDRDEHEIEIGLCLSESELQLTVTDDGHEFNPLEQPGSDRTKPLEERQLGGWGISFLRQLSDQILYRREAGKNVLQLRKSLQP